MKKFSKLKALAPFTGETMGETQISLPCHKGSVANGTQNKRLKKIREKLSLLVFWSADPPPQKKRKKWTFGI